MLKKKLKEIWESTNFRTNLFSLLAAVFSVLFPENIDPQTAMLGIVSVNAYNTNVKIFKPKNDPFWSFLGSSNFWTNLLSIIFSAVAFFGISIPEETASELWQLIEGREWGFIIALIGTNIINPILHIFQKD